MVIATLAGGYAFTEKRQSKQNSDWLYVRETLIGDGIVDAGDLHSSRERIDGHPTQSTNLGLESSITYGMGIKY